MRVIAHRKTAFELTGTDNPMHGPLVTEVHTSAQERSGTEQEWAQLHCYGACSIASRYDTEPLRILNPLLHNLGIRTKIVSYSPLTCSSINSSFSVLTRGLWWLM
jgi:hypothetical protein